MAHYSVYILSKLSKEIFRRMHGFTSPLKRKWPIVWNITHLTKEIFFPHTTLSLTFPCCFTLYNHMSTPTKIHIHTNASFFKQGQKFEERAYSYVGFRWTGNAFLICIMLPYDLAVLSFDVFQLILRYDPLFFSKCISYVYPAYVTYVWWPLDGVLVKHSI